MAEDVSEMSLLSVGALLIQDDGTGGRGVLVHPRGAGRDQAVTDQGSQGF